jgi:uncharacterized membrane protein
MQKEHASMGNLPQGGFLSGGAAIVSIFIAATILRFFGIGEKQLWLDEIIQVLHSRPHSIIEILQHLGLKEGGAPLDYFVQHFLMRAFGTLVPLEVSARFHAALFGSISILLLYVAAFRLLRNRRAAVLAAGIYAFFPLHQHYSQEGRPYALFVLTILLLFILHLQARSHCSRTILVFFAICAVLSYYVHPFTAMFFGALVASNLLELKAGMQKINLQFFSPLIAGMAGAVLFIPWVVYSFASTRGDIARPLSFRMIPALIQGFGDGSYPISILVLSLAVLGAIYLHRSGIDSLNLLGCWILVPIPFLLTILHWRSYFFAIRQLIFVTPAVAILAACGIERLLALNGKKAMVIPAIYTCMSLSVIGLHYPDRRTDFRGAGHFLARTMTEGDRIVAPNTLPILSLYFPRLPEYGTDALECGAGCRRLFFVDTEYASGEERNGFRAVQSTMAIRQTASYRGISVFILVPRFPFPVE